MLAQPFDLGAPAVFITGTDTGVGKTVVAGALAAAARQCGLRVAVMKPVESGCRRTDGRLVPRDALLLREMAGCSAPIDLINPYTLQHPLAPALAADMDDVQIDVGKIATCFRALAASYRPLIVEGAGGLLTPLSGRTTMRELAVALRLPVIVVARNSLGAINHTALTVEAARKAGLDVIGVVLNRVDFEGDEATRTNAASLLRWAGAPLIGDIPFLPSRDAGALAVHGIQIASRIAMIRARTTIPPAGSLRQRRRSMRRGAGNG